MPSFSSSVMEAVTRPLPLAMAMAMSLGSASPEALAYWRRTGRLVLTSPSISAAISPE